MDVHDRLAKNLRRLRHDKGWSQEELAFRSEIHRTFISDLERSRRNPSIEIIDKLARGLAVKLGDLLD